MAKIKGVWVFNDNITSLLSPMTFTESVSFTSNANAYMGLTVAPVDGEYLSLTYSGISNTFVCEFSYSGLGSHWEADAYKIVDFGSTEQDVSDTFLAWMQANATYQKPEPTLTYDLSTLNLNDGTHTITVRANAEGYKSAISNAVSYVVEAPKVKLAAGTYVANDSINIPPSNDNALNFTSNGTSFTSVNVSNRQDDGYRTDDSYLRYGTTNVFWFYDWHEGIDVYEWVNTAYKTITLDTDQEVSSDFATWFNANFSVAPSGIQVTVENTGDSYVEVYDAQTRTNLVGELNDYESGTYTITSGYVYLLGWNFSHVSTTGGVTVKTNTTCYNDLMYYAVYTVTGNGTITCTTCKCFAEGTQISLADGSTKAVEDITMSDNLLVWDFYEGKQSSAKPMWIMPKKEANYYFKVTLSDNTVLNLVGYKINGGSRSHRLYNVKQNAFLYPQDFAEGEHTINEYGELLTINSIECIEETVNYYNIITDTHYNLYAENILTSCRLSNRYGIVDMKYDKNDVRMTEDEVEAYIDNLDAV